MILQKAPPAAAQNWFMEVCGNLQQGDISLVLEALRERGLMLQNAPHLVRNQSFIIPNYEVWGGPFYTIGLKMYDMMAGKLGARTIQEPFF
jgi:glycerol-3-phosphate dehydrogenase